MSPQDILGTFLEYIISVSELAISPSNSCSFIWIILLETTIWIQYNVYYELKISVQRKMLKLIKETPVNILKNTAWITINQIILLPYFDLYYLILISKIK